MTLLAHQAIKLSISFDIASEKQLKFHSLDSRQHFNREKALKATTTKSNSTDHDRNIIVEFYLLFFTANISFEAMESSENSRF